MHSNINLHPDIIAAKKCFKEMEDELEREGKVVYRALWKARSPQDKVDAEVRRLRFREKRLRYWRESNDILNSLQYRIKRKAQRGKRAEEALKVIDDIENGRHAKKDRWFDYKINFSINIFTILIFVGQIIFSILIMILL